MTTNSLKRNFRIYESPKDFQLVAVLLTNPTPKGLVGQPVLAIASEDGFEVQEGELFSRAGVLRYAESCSGYVSKDNLDYVRKVRNEIAGINKAFETIPRINQKRFFEDYGEALDKAYEKFPNGIGV